MGRPLKVAIQMDPLETINADGDSTLALMLEAQSRGYSLWHYGVKSLSLSEGEISSQYGERRNRVVARSRPVAFNSPSPLQYKFGPESLVDLAEMDVVLMRQDPPFDMAYITATHILDHIHPSTLVVNDPGSVRDSPEKLLVTQFPELMPPTLVSWSAEAIKSFSTKYRDVIVKPLFGNGGAGVFRIGPGDENLTALLEMHATFSREPLMVQRYEPAVRQGDKRIILVDGIAMGAINRVPAVGETRANMHVGGRAEPCQLTARDQFICEQIGPTLREKGLLFAGIDVIGEWLTEINVTSPTGLQEVRRFGGPNIAAAIWDAIERRLV